MESKEDILKQVGQIKGALMEQNKFVPYDGNMLIIWGIIGGIMLYGAPIFFEQSLFGGIGFLVGGFAVGFVLEMVLTKKQNDKYALNQFTSIQKNIEYTYAISMAIALVMTIIAIKLEVLGVIYPLWMFHIGFAGFVTGVLANNKQYKIISLLTMLPPMVILGYFAFDIQYIHSTAIYELSRSVSIVLLSGSYIYLGIAMKKRQQCV
jgi:hypothetical protein